MNTEQYLGDAVELLRRLIATPSVSRDERAVADIMEEALRGYGYEPRRVGNNVWTRGHAWSDDRQTLLLNAHLDTVKPVATWTRDPFEPTIEGDRLYGLGSNDCGGGLVSLLQTLRRMDDNCPYNLVYLASCEEEVSGEGGFTLVLPELPEIDVAIVGEPTGMQPAIAEKGLMVCDLIAHGKSGHAARREGVNAIYEAMDDIQFIRNYKFGQVSPLLGETIMTVTTIKGGTQHNVVPDRCEMLLDVRPNELYTNESIYEFLCERLKCEVRAHSFRLESSHIPATHPLVEKCVALGRQPFGSPTLSDQALMPFLSLKMGPGESVRSHSADEYICLSEMRNAMELYAKILS